MRITETMRIANALEIAQQTSSRLAMATRVAASGERAGAPSDDPTTFGAVKRLDARIDLVRARSRTADAAAGDLDLAESALASGEDVLVRAREIAVQMSNGAMDAKARAAASKEVDALREQLIAIGNAKGATGYLFSGLQTWTPPFASNGQFKGDAGVRQVEIADGKTAIANASGALAFTALGGRDILADLATLSSDLANNNVGGIQSAIATMDADREQMSAARIRTGLDAAHLHDASNLMGGVVARLESERAQTGEVDAIGAYSALAQARAAYERAIEITRQILASNQK
jgi:flagellar hook-associated protein 3 FlgL